MPALHPAVQFLVDEFLDAFNSVFQQTSGLPFPFEPAAIAEPRSNAKEKTLNFLISFSGAISGSLHLELDPQSAAILATRFMGAESQGKVEFLSEHEDAVSEIVNQSAGVIEGALRTRFGSADLRSERETDPDVTSSVTVVLARQDGPDLVQLTLFLEQDLVRSSTRACSSDMQVDVGSGNVGANSGKDDQRTDFAARGGFDQQNLEVVMDVELDLTLRFGQRILALSEVADLTSGSVVELDREVDEPVELLLGDRVIARGEVVIVDGNYGLRITEMASVDRGSLLSA